MYDYELTDFALSDAGVHLLRNRFNYKTIAYNDIDKAVIKRGIEAKNPLLSLTVGIALLAVAIFLLASVYAQFTNPSVQVIFIEHILLPLFPLLAGIYLVYIALKKGPVLLVSTSRGKHILRLREVVKTKQLPKLKEYLNNKLYFRLSDEDNI